MSVSNVRNTAHPASSTLRPRGKRLISGLDEGDEIAYDPASAPTTRIASPAFSLLDSRPTSPIPNPHPQRVGRSNGIGAAASLNKGSVGKQRRQGAESPTLAGLWGNSWSALQGIASDLLGSDLAAQDSRQPARVRRPLSKVQGQRSSSSGPSLQWGPSSSVASFFAQPSTVGIGVGTREEQTAAFRAQKRKDLLTRQDTNVPDVTGKYKRRTSDDLTSTSAPPGDHEEQEALVYIHHVQKDDTLAGITIRYNISANTLRKANRMWPHDMVQVRKTLILPVDACAVKGRPVTDLEASDLLRSESDALQSLQAEEVTAPTATISFSNDTTGGSGRHRTGSTSTNATTSAAISVVDLEPLWHHDSWTLLPGQRKPTEIGRMPRKSLGYFPPGRRKSQSHSDLSTPKTSFDTTRGPTNDNSHSASPLRQTPPHQRTTHHHPHPSAASQAYFPTFLSGPGGVGTMASNVHHPGPAQDGLNKFFARHLPDVAPPRNQLALYQPEIPHHDDDPIPTSSSARVVNAAYPNSSAGSAGGPSNLNLEHMGGAIESWVRRLASKATAPAADRQKAARASVGASGKGAGGIGDLIEMTDEFEIGDDETGTEDLLAFADPQIPSVHVSSPTASASATGFVTQQGLRARDAGYGYDSARGAKRGKAD